MRVLLTGATGYVGGWLARGLAARGHRLVAVGRSPPEPGRLPAGMEWVQADLSRPLELPCVDAVVHFAAHASPQPQEVERYLRHNVVATHNLVDWARREGVGRLIFASSVSVHGRVERAVLDEATPVVDPCAYGLSKLLCERLLAETAAAVPALALRLPGVIGPGAATPWLGRLLRGAAAGRPVRLFNPETPFNNAVHVADLADLVDRLLLRPFAGYDVLTLGAAGSLPLLAAVERLLAAAGLRPEIVVEPAAGRRSFCIDSGRAMARYGYRPQEIGAMLDRYAAEMAI